jgi:hypothetical protein
MIMNRKIFTLLASALMLFLIAFTVNARIVGGNLLVGDTVRTLPEGSGKGLYHIRIDKIYAPETVNGPWKWIEANGTNSPLVKAGGRRDVGDTIVLGVTEGGKVVPVSLNDLRKAHSEDATYKDLQSTMWCINIEKPKYAGQMPTFHFTNKAFGEGLTTTTTNNGAVYVGADGEKGWMYSYSYLDGQLNYERPIYRLPSETSNDYTVLYFNNAAADSAIYTKNVSIKTFTDDTIRYMLKFTIVEVAPVVLDAKAFNTRLGEELDEKEVQLAFDPEPNSTFYHNYFGDKLKAEDSDVDDYLNLYVNDSDTVIYNVNNTDDDDDRYTNGLGDQFIQILADGKYDNNKDNNKYRFVYFPSKDSLVINAYSVVHKGHNSIANGQYRDDVVGSSGTGYSGSYKIDAAGDPLHYYGLYNDTILDRLIVRLQDLYKDGTRLLTIGEEPANTRISFGIDNCDVDRKGWQPSEGVYTIWDEEGRCLGVRIDNGSLVPQWMVLETGECPDRIPAYQWVVEKTDKANQTQSLRVDIYNREFGSIGSQYVKMKNVLFEKDKISQIFQGQPQFMFTYDPFTGDIPTASLSVRFGKVAGKYLPMVGTGDCGITSPGSGLRPVAKGYVEDETLGYKYFTVGTTDGKLNFGKSEDIGTALGMDYNAFAFNYYHNYDRTKYIDMKSYRGDTILYVNSNGGKEAFQFRLGTNLRLAAGSQKFAPEVYGYPGENKTYKITDDEGKTTIVTQSVPRLKRYYYELKVADFYNYRDNLSEQFVVLKGAADDGSDINNKLTYGVADVYAGTDPFKFANIYLRETYFLTDEESGKELTLNEERRKQDPSRRIYYAILDRIEPAQHDRLGELGLEVSDTIKGVDGSSGSYYSLVSWRVHETEDGIIKAQGKTVSSVRVSTFALENVNYPLYRRLNSMADDGAVKEWDGENPCPLDAPKIMRIYTQLNNREFLYEDAMSAEADNMGINFLGFANEVQFSDYKYSLFIDTAYINRGTGPIKPQYLIAVGVDQVGKRTVEGGIDGCGDPLPEITIPAYIRGRYLINATDSARRLGSNGENGFPERDKRYISNGSWDRLAFVDAIHVNDRLYIVSELQKRGVRESYLVKGDDGKVYVNGDELGRLVEELELPARSPFNSESYGVYYDFEDWKNYHNDVSFSLRFVKSYAQNADVETGEGGTDNDSKQFLIESETTNREPNGNRKIAPVQGGWVAINNGVPVLSRGTYAATIADAEIFNVQASDIPPTANDPVVSGASLKVASGVGELSILNASGKEVTITNVLGQKVITTTLNSDNVTLKVPKGIVVVTVDGDSVKAIVK